MKIRYSIIVSAATAALMLVGCKPTEKNYRTAYEAALQKREQAAREQMRPATGLLSDDGPQLRMLGNDSVYVQKERMFTLDGKRLRGGWAVAVGLFKIDTNAKASARDLQTAGISRAFPAKVSGGRYYAVADTVATLDEAGRVAEDFRDKFPDYPYVGLPAAPVLIQY